MLSIFMAGWALAAASEPTLLKSYPTKILLNEIVEFRPVENHHFKVEAPQKCSSAGPIEASPRFIKCQFTKAGAAVAELSVCDDKNTSCRPVQVSLQVESVASGEPVRLTKNEHLNQDLKKTLVPGFEMGTPEKIMARARDLGKPVLVMISTDWCPPCNEAKEYLLKSNDFLVATKDWFKVYVDGDNLQASAWEKFVPFRYYPSFVLLNSNFQEVDRFNDELRGELFAKWAKTNEAHLKDPVEQTSDRVLARLRGSITQKLSDLWHRVTPEMKKEDQLRVLKWALDREKTEIVRPLLKHGPFPGLEFAVLNFQLSEVDDNDTKKKNEIYYELLNVALQKEDWAETLSAFCSEDLKACETELEKIPERISFLKTRKDVQGEEKASMLGEEFLYLADVYEKMKKPKEVRDFAAKCIAEYRSMSGKSPLKTARGASQNLVPCFEMAHRYGEAEKELKQLISSYPNEPTFMFRLARVYRGQKNYEQALVWMDKALAKAYGYNWFSGMVLKSDILLDLKKKSEAAFVIDEAIHELRLEKEASSRNQLIAKRLRAAATKIEEFKVE